MEFVPAGRPPVRRVPFRTCDDDYHMPDFPLSHRPRCRHCHRNYSRENRGFRYCYVCPCGADTIPGLAWGTWDDADGVKPGNPICECGYYARVLPDVFNGTYLHTSCAVGECSLSVYEPWRPWCDMGSMGSSGSFTPPVYMAGPEQTLINLPPIFQSLHTPAVRPPTAQAPFAQAPASQVPPSQVPNNQLPTSHPMSGSYAMVTRLLTPARGQPAVDEEFQRLIDHALAAASRLPFPRKHSSVDPSRYLPEGVSPLPPMGVAPPPDYFEPPFVVEARNEFEKHAKIAACGEALAFGMINNMLLRHKSMLYQDDWRSVLFNLIRMHHPVFAGWDLNPDVIGPNLAFPDDDGVFTKVLIAHGYLDAKKWGNHAPFYLIDVKTSLRNICEEFFLTDVERKRMMGNIHPSPNGKERPTIYIIMRVTNMQALDVKVQIHVDPASGLHHTNLWVSSVPRSERQ